MPAVGGEDHRVRIRIDRACFRFQLAKEELVEVGELIYITHELIRIEFIVLDERSNLFACLRLVHSPTIPVREQRSLHDHRKRKTSGDRAVRPTQCLVAIHLFDAVFVGVSVVIDDFVHEWFLFEW